MLAVMECLEGDPLRVQAALPSQLFLDRGSALPRASS